MKKLIIVVTLVFLFLTFPILTISQSSQLNNLQEMNVKSAVTQNQIVKVELNLTAPDGYELPQNTPIIINLSTIGEKISDPIDPFGKKTTDPNDDIKWDSAYVTYKDDLIPSQVDDVDENRGFSEGDELLFVLPENVTLGNPITLSIFLGTKELNLPPPYFLEVCDVYIYPKIDEINALFPDMLGRGDGAYYIENEILQACALVEAAWSSGGLYELSILDKNGESQWDVIKQKYKNTWEFWKWARFSLIEQFISKNQFANTFPFKLERVIRGPVRAQIQMQSKSDYGKGGTIWGNIKDLYGLVTYDIYANQPYLDYTLEMVGPNAANHPTLIIQLQNREWGGKPGSPYLSIYTPGKGWSIRNPNDILTHTVKKAEFSETWYLEGLNNDQVIVPPSLAGPDDDQLGYGFIFEDTGFTNISWDAGSEDIISWYDACEFPFRTRYCPFDASILKGQDRIAYMEDRYQEWLRPSPKLDVKASLVTVADIPFEYLFVNPPDIIFKNETDTLDITNVTAFSTVTSEFITEATSGVTATYKILFEKRKQETDLSGSLVWDASTNTWGAKDLDVSSLDLESAYVVVAYFETTTLSGRSSSSERFTEGIDIFPPIILTVTREPEDVRSTDYVNITADVIDEEGEVKTVILSYSNGTSWYNITMNTSYGLYKGTIPPQKSGSTISYMIFAYDDAFPANSNVTEVFTYFVQREYQSGQALIPLLGISGILIAVVIIAFKSGALHRQKYDQIE